METLSPSRALLAATLVALTFPTACGESPTSPMAHRPGPTAAADLVPETTAPSAVLGVTCRGGGALDTGGILRWAHVDVAFASGATTHVTLSCSAALRASDLDRHAEVSIPGGAGPWTVHADLYDWPGSYEPSCHFSGDALPSDVLTCDFGGVAFDLEPGETCDDVDPHYGGAVCHAGVTMRLREG